MQKIVESIQKEISKKRLYNTVKEVSNFHRIQASTGFREAAEFVCKKMTKMGIDAQIMSFVADENHWYLQQKLFQEWDCKGATLDLIDQGIRLCDFEEEAISVIQKSYPCDEEKLNVVMVESNDPAYLDTLELEGAIAFIHTMPNQYLYSVIKERKAVGFITDFMREVSGVRTRNDAYDTLNYTSFWWNHEEDEPKTFGFVLSPRNGDYLRKLCLEYEANYQKDPSQPRYPTVKAKIDSSIYPGYMEVVEATLPGKSKDTIMMCAHLCHPRASANDNASGVSGSIEALRVLKKLQDEGKITLEKTIKLILVPEFTGTFCYLSTLENYDHIKGAINMDMIGGKQDGFYGPVTVTKTHHALNSPINMIASAILDMVKKQVPDLNGNKVPMVNAILGEYTGGSDHTVFNDVTLDIPCVMLGQWPDKYYHTSSDTLECVDPNVLAFSTSFAASYVYALCNFNEEIHQQAFFDGIHLMYKDMENIAKNEQEHPQERLERLIQYYQDSVNNFTKLGKVKVSKDKKDIVTFGKAMLAHLGKQASPIEIEEDHRIPSRLFVGPVREIVAYRGLNENNKKVIEQFDKDTASLGFGGRMLGEYILNYVDGKRTISEIVKEVYLETGKMNYLYAKQYLELLEALNLVQLN